MEYSTLQLREVFHLEFIRELVKKIPASTFVLKGGSNLRYFFNSIRYSEDIDLDVQDIPVDRLRTKCLDILVSRPLLSRLRSFGIEELVPPDMGYAKQTETVQRFKIHLHTSSGEDLFTKIEFSRRGFDSPYQAESVTGSVLSIYRLPPLIFPHYLTAAAIKQKINALISRQKIEARDVFDLFILSSRLSKNRNVMLLTLTPKEKEIARERVYSIEYQQYKDQVVSFLCSEDQAYYSSHEVWDEIRLVAISLIDNVK